MKEVRAEQRKVIVLGVQGEHLARCILFDIADWQLIYGEGTVQLLAQRCQDKTPYPCVVAVRDGAARWEVRDVDVAMPGKGRVELQYRVGGAVVKSEIYPTLTMKALGEVGPVPAEPEKAWLDAVLQAADDAEESAREAREAVRQTITMGQNGNWLVGGEDTGVSAVGPQGQRGETGAPVVAELFGAVQSLVLANNTDYRCIDPVTGLTVTGFEADADGRSEVWSIHFAAGSTIGVTLPGNVVWNYGATPVFTPHCEYWLMFTPLLNGKVLGVWNEVKL